jgi:hypothetical protein
MPKASAGRFTQPGFVIWLFGYMSTGHAVAFDWKGATPWWISSFVPNLEAELGLALMFASMIPIYWRQDGSVYWGPDQISEATLGSLKSVRDGTSKPSPLGFLQMPPVILSRQPTNL